MAVYTGARALRPAMLAVIVGAALVGGMVEPSPALGACWPPPVDAPVSEPFVAPACPWCAGHRGVEFDTERGDAVRSAAAGRVTFAGVVAGIRYLVVAVSGGLRLTYGNLASARFAAGDLVVAGVVLGSAAGPLHFGVRDGDRYLDPAAHLGRWRYRLRLVPVDGPSPPAPRRRCGAMEWPRANRIAPVSLSAWITAR